MARVVNVHQIDDETFYLVRLTPQEIRPILPPGLNAETLPEGQVFLPWLPNDDETGDDTGPVPWDDFDASDQT